MNFFSEFHSVKGRSEEEEKTRRNSGYSFHSQDESLPEDQDDPLSDDCLQSKVKKSQRKNSQHSTSSLPAPEEELKNTSDTSESEENRKRRNSQYSCTSLAKDEEENDTQSEERRDSGISGDGNSLDSPTDTDSGRSTPEKQVTDLENVGILNNEKSENTIIVSNYSNKTHRSNSIVSDDRSNVTSNASEASQILPFTQRIGLGMIKMILFGYKTVATFGIISFHCVPIKGVFVLFINGEEKCYQPWQYVEILLVALWVIPFPLALMLSYRMYMRHVISLKKLVLCLVFPYLSIYFLLTTWTRKSLLTDRHDEKRVTVLLKEMFEEAYRKRHGKEYYVFWETWRYVHSTISMTSVSLLP